MHLALVRPSMHAADSLLLDSYVSFFDLFAHQFNQCLQCQEISTPAQPNDMSSTDRRNQRLMSKWLTGINITEMYLDDRRFHHRQDIAQCNRVVCQRASIDDNAIRTTLVLL